LNNNILLQNAVVVVSRTTRPVGRKLLHGKHLTNPLTGVFSYLSHQLLYVMEKRMMPMLVL
jgi:hypothetical protein